MAEEEKLDIVGGLDPGFGGDACVLVIARLGYTREGLYTISFETPRYIPIKANIERPKTYQIVDNLRIICGERGLSIANVAIDDSGTQSVADVVQVECGVVPIRVNFGAKAPEYPIGPVGLPACERFRNDVTALWFTVAELGRHNQVRNMPGEAIKQFCDRRFRRDRVPLALETKAEYKKRTGRSSPDEGDAVALACRAARVIAGLIPGAERQNQRGHGMGWGPGPNIRNGPKTDYTKSLDFSGLSSYAS